MTHVTTLSQKIKSGVGWVLIGRMLDRLVDLAKIPILAFLLSPSDFGLMGIIMSLLLYLDVLTRTGFNAKLIHDQNLTDCFDVSWTVAFFRGVIQCLVILLSVNWIADFYNAPSLIPLFYAISFCTVFDGMLSARLVQLLRDIDMKRYTLYQSGARFFSSLVTIGAAYYFRDVWALVVGHICLTLYKLVASYIIAPYRPRFDFDKEKFKSLWNYGKWIVLSGILIASINHLDSLFIGKVKGLTALGYYTMAYNIGRIVPTELVDNLRRIFFPAFSSMQNDLARLKNVFLKTYSFTVLLGGLLSLELFFLSKEIVTIFLGNTWSPVIPILKIFAVWCLFQIALTSIAPLLMSVGRPLLWTKINFLRLIFMGALLYPLTVYAGILGAAYAVLVSTLFVVPLCFLFASRAIACSWKNLIQPFLIVFVCAIIISFMFMALGSLFESLLFVRFVVIGMLIAIIYVSVVLIIDNKFNFGLREDVRGIIDIGSFLKKLRINGHK